MRLSDKSGIHLDPHHPDALDPTLVVPESLVVIVEEHPEGSPLSSLIKRFGGYEGRVTDLFGQERTVSLEPWRNADPEKTRLQIGFRYQPSDKGRHAT
jgi:hypothetical protein